MKFQFTFDAYRELLQRLVSIGYQAIGFESAEPAKRHLVLRHDVDMTLESAVRMATVEAELSLPACYFVLVRNGLYNPFSGVATAAMQQLGRLGHEIGLHFDTSLYPGAPREELDRYCAIECGMLETWLQRPVRVVSFHRPAPALLGLEHNIAGRIHTYQPRFFKQMTYCSDSKGGWHHGHPLELAAVKEGRALQLLTHPIWWDAPGGEAPAERIDRFAVAQGEWFREELARNCEPYAKARAARAHS